MKKMIISLSFLCIYYFGYSQVFNTGQTLSTRSFNIGVEPVIIIDGPASPFMLFTHAGVGLKSGLDFSVKAGFGTTNYFGGDVEFGLGRYFSVMAGAHQFGDFGLDACILGTYPIKNDVRLTSGLDTDLNIIKTNDNPNTQKNEGGTEFRPLVFLPISLEIGLRSNLAFIFETEIGLTQYAYHIIGGGISFYF